MQRPEDRKPASEIMRGCMQAELDSNDQAAHVAERLSRGEYDEDARHIADAAAAVAFEWADIGLVLWAEGGKTYDDARKTMLALKAAIEKEGD